MKRIAVLNSTALKIIAAITMLVDHLGVIIFPQYVVFRVIGRISFPLYAFMIAQGCRYTRNRLRHFLIIFGLGSLFQLVFWLVTRVEYMGILITFSASIVLINVLQDFKNQLYHGKWQGRIFAGALFVALVVFCFVITDSVVFDYGITGIMLPVVFYLPNFIVREDGQKSRGFLKAVDSNVVRVLLAIPVLILYAAIGNQEWYHYCSLLSLPFLLLYSGKRGRISLKWFFYIFYPVHLVAIYAIYYLMKLPA